MHSSQLNFFTVPEDWMVFERFFSDHEIQILKYRSEKADDFFVNHVLIENERLPFQLGLTHADFSTDIITKYNDRIGKFELDIEKSPIIEFDTGGFYANNSKKLHRARFYCVNNYFARRGELVTKEQRFKKWVSYIYRLFKKEFLKKMGEENTIMFTENTRKWMKENNAQIDGGYLSLSLRP